jgi:hypothetical protein
MEETSQTRVENGTETFGFLAVGPTAGAAHFLEGNTPTADK